MTPDGAVRAMVGGRDYAASQFNRATQARAPARLGVQAVRLPGGARGGPAAGRPDLGDAPIAVGGWQPRNFDDRYPGEITLADAFARSINTVAVRLSEQVGRGA